MAKTDSRVTIHMAASLDGFIARKDGRVDWLETSDEFVGGDTMDPAFVEAFLKSIDCYVMGSRTYETALRFEAKGLGWAYGDKPVFVLTSRKLPRTRKTVEFYSGDLVHFVNGRLRPAFRTIWFVGGGFVSGECLRLGLADEVRYSILPILIGDGIPFFERLGRDVALHLTEVKGYKNGMVALCYEVRTATKKPNNSPTAANRRRPSRSQKIRKSRATAPVADQTRLAKTLMSQLFRLSGTVKRDPAIENWLKAHTGELGAIAEHWFEVMRKRGDDVREVLHDGHPTACVADAAFAYVNAFKAHVNVGFFRGAEIADPKSLLEGTGKVMRHVKLRAGHEFDATALTKLVDTAYTDMKERVQAESRRAHLHPSNEKRA